MTAHLTIVHDPLDPPLRIVTARPEACVATLDIPADLSAADIHDVARRLAELLLEQVRRGYDPREIPEC